MCKTSKLHGKDFRILSRVLDICTAALHNADLVLGAFRLNCSTGQDFYLFSNSLRQKRRKTEDGFLFCQKEERVGARLT